MLTGAKRGDMVTWSEPTWTMAVMSQYMVRANMDSGSYVPVHGQSQHGQWQLCPSTWSEPTWTVAVMSQYMVGANMDSGSYVPVHGRSQHGQW